jgi:hypothetical protein
VRTLLIVAATFALAFSGCVGTTPRTIPTAEEATASLNRLVTLARAGDFEELCAIGDGNCPRTLAEVGADARPLDPPTVVGSRSVEPNEVSGALGGRVLELCGVDGRGREYYSEILVFRDDAGLLRVINPVYWSGITIAGGQTTIASPAATPSCP